MANNSSGVYGGVPFSYLSKTSPTDQNPPRSPRVSSRSDYDRNRGSEIANDVTTDTEKQPFSYLNPNSPTERDSDVFYDNRVTLDEEQGQGRYPEKRIGSDPTHFTSVKDFTSRDDRNSANDGDRYDSRLGLNRGRDQPKSSYVISDYAANERDNYELAGGRIPRPKIIGEKEELSPRSAGGREFRYNPDDGYGNNEVSNGRVRPVSRDSYLDSSHRRRKQCSPATVCVVVLLVILALGGGFAAGWFASKYVNDAQNEDVSSTEAANSTPLSTTATAAISSTPTTAAVNSIPTTTTATVATTTATQPGQSTSNESPTVTTSSNANTT